MKAIFKREFRSAFTGVSGYVLCAFILLFAGIYMNVLNLKNGYANFEYVVANMAFIFLIIIPILTMRSVSEDRKQRTDTLLYSLPMSTTQIVLGKYLAMLAVLLIPILIIGLYPLILSFFGSVYLPLSYGTLLAFFMLGGALAAIGMFISSLTENQLVSAVICLVVLLINYYLSVITQYLSYSSAASAVGLIVILLAVCFVIYMLTKNPIISGGIALVGAAAVLVINAAAPTVMEGLLGKILSQASLFEQFYSFPDGVFDITALVYFIVVAGVFIFFTVQSMEKRRWS